MEAKVHVGIISKLFPDHQYGKIETSLGEEAHFHKLCLWNIHFNEIQIGQSVEFEMQPANNGNIAFHIRFLKG